MAEQAGVVETRFGHKVLLTDFQRINAEVMRYSHRMFWDRGIIMSHDAVNSMLNERFAAVAIH